MVDGRIIALIEWEEAKLVALRIEKHKRILWQLERNLLFLQQLLCVFSEAELRWLGEGIFCPSK